MADPVLQDTIKVTVKDVSYEFSIPGYLDEIKMGMRERTIRREIEAEMGLPLTAGEAVGLDNQTAFMIEVVAIFETLLKTCSSTWPYSNGAGGQPTVDFRKWPKDKMGEALAVGVVYRDELARFLNGGVANGDATGTEVVASGDNPS